MMTRARLLGLFAVVALAGCAAPVEVWPPSWHPASVQEAGASRAWEGRALAGTEPVAPAEEGVVPPNAGKGMGEHEHHEHHGHGVHGGGEQGAGGPGGGVDGEYVCPMHPHVTSNMPGSCPECGMKLVEKREGGDE